MEHRRKNERRRDQNNDRRMERNSLKFLEFNPPARAGKYCKRLETLHPTRASKCCHGRRRQMQNPRSRPEGCIPTVLRLRLRTLAYSERLAKENAPVGRFLEAVSPQEPV